MPSYKLTYFNGRGRGELTRLCFVAAGQKFEDVRVEFSDWAALKPKTPQGSMPVLEIDGKTTMCQSMSIARHLAREFKLYGKKNLESAIVDQVMDTCLDLFTPYITIAFNSDKEEQAKQKKEFLSDKVPKVLGFLEDLIKQTGTKGFSVGQTLSVADLNIYCVIEGVIEPLVAATQEEDVLAKFPKIAEVKKTVEQLPKIKEYLAKRPKTDF